MEYNLFVNPPVSYEPLSPNNKSFIWHYIKSIKTKIFIGIICVILFVIVLVIPLKIILSKTKDKKPSQQQEYHFHIDETKPSIIEIKDDYPTTLNCAIPLHNAKWNEQGIIFVNKLGKCGSNNTELCNPHDLFIDNIHNNLYVVDKGNNRIQKYSLTQPVINNQTAIGSTVASEGLIAPSSIFVDILTEDMYILDYNKDKIRDPTDPAVYRVHFWSKNANSGRILLEELGEYYFGLYSHIVLDQQMNIYVETRFHIRKWFASTHYTQVITVAGTTEAGGKLPNELFDPRGLYIDNDLTMYIVDWNNHRIQKWLADANQATTLVSDLLYVYGITQDCNGNIYYGDVYRHVVYQLDIRNNQTRIIIGNDIDHQDERRRPLHSPFGMKLDKFGNMFVIDGWDSQIKKFSIT